MREQEKAYLYQNALDYATTNNLQLGDALTQTQINALDKPMLWYVEQTVPDPSCTATGTATFPTITALMVALASSFTGAFQRGLHFQSAALSALEVPENKTRIPVTLEDGTETIVVPDGIKGQTFIEVKDVKDIYNAKQFRGYFASGNAIQLIVSPNTQTISGPLQALINRSGGSIRVYDPGTGKFTPWGTS